MKRRKTGCETGGEVEAVSGNRLVFQRYRHSRHLPPSNCGQIPLRPRRRGRYRDDRFYSRAAKCVRIANGQRGSRRNTETDAVDGKRARIPTCNSLRWIRAETKEFVPFRSKWGSRGFGKRADAFCRQWERFVPILRENSSLCPAERNCLFF